MARFAVLTAFMLSALAAGQEACTPGADCANDDAANVNLLQVGYSMQSRIDMNKLATDGFTRYWVDDGCQSEVGVEGDVHSENMVEDDVSGHYHDVSEEVAGPRCCTDDGTSCSTPGIAGSTCLPMTFAQASQVCTDEGKRLCTKSELLSDICCGTGGNCDSYAVWTSTPDYTKYSGEACKGRNELYKGTSTGLSDCAAKCSQDATCVSFEFWPNGHPTQGSNFCQLSSTCTVEFKSAAKLGADLYIKADDNAPANGDLPPADGPAPSFGPSPGVGGELD